MGNDYAGFQAFLQKIAYHFSSYHDNERDPRSKEIEDQLGGGVIQRVESVSIYIDRFQDAYVVALDYEGEENSVVFWRRQPDVDDAPSMTSSHSRSHWDQVIRFINDVDPKLGVLAEEPYMYFRFNVDGSVHFNRGRLSKLERLYQALRHRLYWYTPLRPVKDKGNCGYLDWSTAELTFTTNAKTYNLALSVKSIDPETKHTSANQTHLALTGGSNIQVDGDDLWMEKLLTDAYGRKTEKGPGWGNYTMVLTDQKIATLTESNSK